MNKYPSLDEIEKSVNQFLSSNQVDEALLSVKAFVENVLSWEWTTGVIFSSKRLDDLCMRIGASITKPEMVSEQPLPTNNTVAYVATELFSYGGHTAIIEDMIRLQPDRKHVIFLTHLLKLSCKNELMERFQDLPVEIIFPPSEGLEKKLFWLQTSLRKLNPLKTYLFNHNQDSVAIAALQPNLVHELLYYHHGDHTLCLGVHLHHSIHIDPHSRGYHHCRNKLNVENNVYWPITVNDLSPTNKLKTDTINTCSSGSLHKYVGSYLYSYFDLIPEIIQATKGTHTHIGPLSPEILETLYQSLDRNQIPRTKFIHKTWVKSVWQTLIDLEINQYISSFPYGGGRACIEAMGAGIPVIVHDNYRSMHLNVLGIAYPEAFCWHQPNELIEHLERLTPQSIEEQSRFSRTHYENHHKNEFLSNQLYQSKGQVLGIPPSLCRYAKPDSIQLAVDLANQVHQQKCDYHLILAKELDDARTDLQILYSSSCWKMTKPLRDLKDFASLLKAKLITS